LRRCVHGPDLIEARNHGLMCCAWRWWKGTCERCGQPVHSEEQRIGGRSMESMTGQLLVATPTLKDPNFDRTVVLLVAHETGGALGVVLNRATEVPVADVLGGWGELAGDPAVLFEGGPVQPESAICLARTRPDVKRRVNGFHH